MKMSDSNYRQVDLRLTEGDSGDPMMRKITVAGFMSSGWLKIIKKKDLTSPQNIAVNRDSLQVTNGGAADDDGH